MSAPKSNGRWKKGDAKVLSTSSSALARCAISAEARRSVMRISGFVGVSTNTMRVRG
jgi:hypothetical protein